MIERRRSRNGCHHGRAAKEPGEANLRHGGPKFRRDSLEGPSRPRKFAARQREPRYESDLVLFAVLDDVIRALLADVVLVLHADNGHDLLSRFDLSNVDFGKPDFAYFALVAQRFE